jgi:signal transduction histidine kinase
VILLIVSVQFLAQGLGLTGTLVWPLAVAGAGIALATGAATLGLHARTARLIGLVLVVAGGAAFIDQNSGGAATTVLVPGAVTIALLLVVGPWAWRLARERDAERAARIRTEERADLAARVHDSVLQTLALIQREPHDARRVATLARRQERELRAWLYPHREPAPEGTLADAVEAAVTEIEELHGVRIELARSGDAPLDERTGALVLAAREAMANAAKHAGTEDVSVFVEAGDGRVAIYVRDRGVGFDPAAVAADRRGVSESIRARVERVGGVARVVSSPGAGTEVELELPAEGPR